jgi:DNA-binding response OmpR family regulator
LASHALFAVHLALKIRPGLILLGFTLPGDDGCLTMTCPQSHLPLAHFPMIIIAAADASIHQDRALEAGADAFVQKPIDKQ